mgnify:CR=1 FL=1
MGRTFQNIRLFKGLTVEENVMCAFDPQSRYSIVGGLLPTPKRRDEEKRGRELCEKYLTVVGMQDYLHERPENLSYGMQRRIEIARALMCEPKILLLDEPFSALDSFLRWELEQEVMAVTRQFGGTTLLVSHNRDEVYRIAGSIAVYGHGSVDRVGDKWDLFRDPQTAVTARLTGCKNIAPARWEGDRVTVPDWGPPLAARHPGREVNCVGLRAHYLRVFANPAEAAGLPNQILCSVDRVIDSTFSTIVMLRTPGGGLLRYECEKDVWSRLACADELTVSVDPSVVMPLAGGGSDA